MQGTLLLIAMLMLLNWLPSQEATPLAAWLAIPMSCLGAGLGLWLWSWLLRRRPPRQPQWSFRLGASLGLFALMLWWIEAWHWANATPLHLMQLLPAILLLNVAWWLESGLQRPIPPPRLRWQWLVQRWRFDLLLPILAICASDAIRLLAAAPWQYVLGQTVADWIPILLELGFLALLLVGAGPVMAWIWQAKPAEGRLLERIQHLAARVQVRLRSCWTWPGGELPFYNAMAVGFLPRFRDIFISSDLEQALKTDELDAVLGHELGHLRRSHHLLFVLYIAVLMLAAVWFAEHGVHLLQLWALPTTLLALIQMTAIAGFLLLSLRVGFGWISRLCERQADLEGVACTGSIDAMQAALRKVAQLSGQALDAPSWRHHSVAARLGFLHRVRLDPGLAPWHHWMVTMLRMLLLILLTVLLVLHLRFPAMASVDPNSWATDHPDLIAAIELARENQATGPLQRELGEAEPRTRLALVVYLTMRYQEQTVGELVDPRPSYRDRAVLRTLLEYRTGHPKAKATLANMLAYGLMAGTATPSAAEIREAEELLAPIAKELDEREVTIDDAHHLDTLGCIDLRAGRFAVAAERFATAQRLYQDSDLVDEPDIQAFLPLLQRRISAAKTHDKDLPLEWSPNDEL